MKNWQEEENLQWICGFHAVRALLEGAGDDVRELVVRRGRDDRRIHQLLRCARDAQVPVRRAERAELDRLAGVQGHQGILAGCRDTARVYDQNWLMETLNSFTQPLLLVLDGVSDPHNLGACLRSAAAAGADAVAVPRMRAAPLTPVVHKVSAGAVTYVPMVRLANLARALQDFRRAGLWVVGSDTNASTSLYSLDLNVPLVLVMGVEGSGLRRLTREHCDVLASLPMAHPQLPLNLSVAAGVCLFEARRQRDVTA